MLSRSTLLLLLLIGRSPQLRAQVVPAPGDRFFVALLVPDVQASASWYRDVFNLTVEQDLRSPDSSTHTIILSSPHLVVELLQLRGAEPAVRDPDKPFLDHGFYKVGLYVSDLPAFVSALKAKGVSFRYDLVEDPAMGLRFAIIRDNAGNLIQLFEPIPTRNNGPRRPGARLGASAGHPGSRALRHSRPALHQ